MIFRSIFIAVIISSVLFSKDEKNETDAAKVSETLGHLIGKNLDALGLDFDINLVVKGLKDAANGVAPPMSESECIDAIGAAQEADFKEKAKNNLEMAEVFLKQNKKNKGIVSIEDGKLQYKIEKAGSGKKVEPHFAPLIRYVGKYLDGSVFTQSKEGEVLSLDESIPGFSKGLVGMLEGEKRTLYIHPEYAYGTQGYLPPNSLLTFEIEVVKANSPIEKVPDPLIIESNKEKQSNDLDSPVVR